MEKAEEMEQDLDDYFRQRFENRAAIRSDGDDCKLSMSVSLLAKKEELKSVERDLRAKKAWFRSSFEEITRQREVLQHKKEKLQLREVEVGNLLEEKDKERRDALKKASEERNTLASKHRELAQCTENLRILNENKDDLERKVDQNALFFDFMQRAVDSSDEYKTIADILERFEVLTTTKQYLLDRERMNQDSLETEKLSLLKYSDDQNKKILALNRQLAEQQSRYDQARRTAELREKEWNRIKSTAAEKTKQLGQIKMAIYNLFELCNTYHKKHSASGSDDAIQLHDTAAQLERIREVLDDLRFICEETRRAEAQHGTA